MFPDQPLAQTQENWFTSSTHVPPFRHGEEAHSLMSELKGTEKGHAKKRHCCISTIFGNQIYQMPALNKKMTSFCVHVRSGKMKIDIGCNQRLSQAYLDQTAVELWGKGYMEGNITCHSINWTVSKKEMMMRMMRVTQ